MVDLLGERGKKNQGVQRKTYSRASQMENDRRKSQHDFTSQPAAASASFNDR
jgi:hypothetical protein